MKRIIIFILIIIFTFCAMIYNVEPCTISEVSNNDTYITVVVEYDNNLYSADYGLHMLNYFDTKEDATVIFYQDKIITII